MKGRGGGGEEGAQGHEIIGEADLVLFLGLVALVVEGKQRYDRGERGEREGVIQTE